MDQKDHIQERKDRYLRRMLKPPDSVLSGEKTLARPALGDEGRCYELAAGLVVGARSGLAAGLSLGRTVGATGYHSKVSNTILLHISHTLTYPPRLREVTARDGQCELSERGSPRVMRNPLNLIER